MKYEVQASVHRNSVNAPQVGIYSQLALPLAPSVGWGMLLKNLEALIKFTPQRVAAFAFMSAGALTLVQQAQIGRLYDSKSNVLAEGMLEKNMNF